MNHALPISLVLLLAWLAVEVLPQRLPQLDQREELPTSHEVLPPDPTAAQPPGGPLTGQEMVAQAAQRLLMLPGIEAKTFQRVNIFGQQLVGSGTYFQLTRGPRMMLRLDMLLKVADHSTLLQQISDGNTYWVRRTQAEETSLQRVNLRRLRDAASQVGPSAAPPPPTLWMALGGLPKLFAALDQHCEFAPPQPIYVGKGTAKLPAWSVEGHWKPAMLANLLPDQRAAILAGQPADLTKLPSHLPHGVTLILGRDQVIPLFPYGITFYRHADDAPSADSPATREELVSWRLYEVRCRTDLNSSLFDYRPSDSQQVEERTDEYIARLRTAMGERGDL